MGYNCGIYQILNKKTGKRYIGSSKNIRLRWNSHRSALRLGKHHAIMLQRSYNRHGAEAFEYSVLLYCDKNNLAMYEQALLDGFKPFGDDGYNILPSAYSMSGHKLSPDVAARKKELLRRTRASVEWNGKKLTKSELSEMAGLRIGTVTRRMTEGWTLEQAATTPLGARDVRYDGFGKSLTSVEWAKEMGVSKSFAHNTLKAGGRPEDLYRIDKRMTLNELSKFLGLSNATVAARILQGWQLIDALSVPAVRTGYAHEVQRIKPRKIRNCYVG